MIRARVVMAITEGSPEAIVAVERDGELIQHVRAGEETLQSVLEERDLDPELLEEEVCQRCCSMRALITEETQRLDSLFPLDVWRPV